MRGDGNHVTLITRPILAEGKLTSCKRKDIVVAGQLALNHVSPEGCQYNCSCGKREFRLQNDRSPRPCHLAKWSHTVVRLSFKSCQLSNGTKGRSIRAVLAVDSQISYRPNTRVIVRAEGAGERRHFSYFWTHELQVTSSGSLVWGIEHLMAA